MINIVNYNKYKRLSTIVVFAVIFALLAFQSAAVDDANAGVNNGIENGDVADGNLDAGNAQTNDGLGANDVPNQSNGNADTPQEDMEGDGIIDGDTLDDIIGGGDDGVTSDNHETVADETGADAAESIENGNDGGFNVAGVVIAVIIGAAVIALIIILIPKKRRDGK